MNELLKYCGMFAKFAGELKISGVPSKEDEFHLHEMLTRIFTLLTFEEYPKAIKFLIEFDQIVKNFNLNYFEETFYDFIDAELWNKVHQLANNQNYNSHDIQFLHAMKNLIMLFDGENLLK